MHDLYGKVGVVTGAASGIGKVLVDSFLRVGMKVVMADIDEEKLKEEVVHYLNSGAEVLGVVCDVSQPEHVERLSQKSLETFGAVHLLCNNAGVGYNGFRSWEA
ncbi:MAG: SDR family NAD(P)-dependent oxidoreductase, partial [Desulfobacteraceae bacterium]